MQKTILITGATDGIGLETARKLVAQDHNLLLHGRSQEKLDRVKTELSKIAGKGFLETYLADLSDLSKVDELAEAVLTKHLKLDVLINNAGILKSAEPITSDGLDVRFVVNTLAPYRLAQRLNDIIGTSGRIINLSSAAQAPVNLSAMSGQVDMDAMDAYSQSKLAITMWSMQLARQTGSPIVIAVNPGSLLGSKMVKEGFGMEGHDLAIGADILVRAALSEEFAQHSGEYFDNDSGRFSAPHTDALDAAKTAAVVQRIDDVINQVLIQKENA
jgi:NAD(P)-dependent dehydrogenase (short-subunit alcohol dehydrogenase family)